MIDADREEIVHRETNNRRSRHWCLLAAVLRRRLRYTHNVLAAPFSRVNSWLSKDFRGYGSVGRARRSQRFFATSRLIRPYQDSPGQRQTTVSFPMSASALIWTEADPTGTRRRDKTGGPLTDACGSAVRPVPLLRWPRYGYCPTALRLSAAVRS